MNPRVSRSSALASKATGFPIAKISAKLALGYTLDEIANDITRETPAAFEPSLDYVVVKVPRFAFEKFPGADPVLTTHMKSVGEAMAIGRNFPEALNKALRSLETPAAGFWTVPDEKLPHPDLPAIEALKVPHEGRIYTVERALREGASVEDVYAASGIDPWFVDQVASCRRSGKSCAAHHTTRTRSGAAKRAGFSDRQIAAVTGSSETAVRERRHGAGIRPVYKTVDTCAAEFMAHTPYHYSSYDEETEVVPREREAVIVLGSGPNRIGQGIEFDYACCHAAFALSDAGYETVMVNCNPETVSTDYDTSDRLYFEPLTVEDVLEIVAAETEAGPVAGVVVQLGGQTPLGLAAALERAGVPIVGTTPSAIHLAEDRREFGKVLDAAGLLAPRFGTAFSYEEAREVAAEIGYPVLVRPSYVLGGRGMEIVYDATSLQAYVSRATEASPEHPILVDRLPRRRGRGRCRRHLRRHRALPRRRHGAHRGGRHPLRRLGLCAAADHARQGRPHPHPPGDRGHRARRRSTRAGQRAVRRASRRALRAGGQSAGVTDRPVRRQGDRGAGREGRFAGHARRLHRAAARPRDCCPPRATAPTCRSTATSR